ncbi:3-hydroxybutyrate dehydrogenase [Pseudogracilibacillus auburnensis]|uniref:3-hydroxybutyrate dehydrogenase n=1 Tax=Pseudogracilibacillus auburnensis TaxID=1494959 RepID=A0A2V3WBC2_9BACI|nr:3-hydroxybutyrate dehydrogenase [Pseudogracilibacillus auburnensis]MBO1003678.1 3-hydroxybutyrate dehydrogenase [Pseudogracilibacillus auburnensis]PXW90311.1 3-hydroxybutyrate dehydrogenase [Pseudogracilibacillus auburnensis]
MVAGKVVVITGAASGIGLHIGQECVKSGSKVVFTDINKEKLTEAMRGIQQDGDACISMSCDVTKEANMKHVIENTIDIHGRIDVLINNAGLQHVASIEHFPVEKFEQMIKVMLVAPFLAIKSVFPLMKQQKFGRIINIASINGLIGFSGKAAYNSAKHGVIGLTKVAALEGAKDGITVNALCPGYVDTQLVRDQLKDLAKNRNTTLENVLMEVIYPFVPQKRLLEPKEVADYVLFLASEKAKGITGQAVVIDGGYTAQ